jgi:hypothetical protein
MLWQKPEREREFSSSTLRTIELRNSNVSMIEVRYLFAEAKVIFTRRKI